ncbi:hypothetical protein FACS1894172_04200 [Spirochaetia bacterium]|nr:hypothetical protein FACS1894164_07140 [Spirochaetia bacterium]GHU30623.1 hypothetical protein FACS1894172_04200 [Spirochaetia bacterium]
MSIGDIIPIVAAVIILTLVVLVIVNLTGRSKNSAKDSAGGKSTKARKTTTFKDASKKLSQNPRDPGALAVVADAYFTAEDWEKASKTYQILLEVASQGSEHKVNEFEAYQRYGICAVNLEQPDDAYRALQSAYALKQDDFEVNYNLGTMEFQKKGYDKAIVLLQAARSANPEHTPTLRCLGQSFFRMNRYKDAMTSIRRAIELSPDDKESLFVLGECYNEAGQPDQALKIFSHLRPDPGLGPDACLNAGLLNFNQNQFEASIEDFEIGLKHEAIKPETLLELRYRLAVAYIRVSNISKALPLLKQVNNSSPDYKDVKMLITKYQELNSNKNLQIFLMASSADFVALCRRIVMGYFTKSRVKIADISLHMNDWADILTEVDTQKWSDTVMFRFIRTTGPVGEMVVRDFHQRFKEVKAGQGICITAGIYSEEARRFTEARLITLVDKEKLAVILKSIDSKVKNA